MFVTFPQIHYRHITVSLSLSKPGGIAVMHITKQDRGKFPEQMKNRLNNAVGTAVIVSLLERRTVG